MSNPSPHIAVVAVPGTLTFGIVNRGDARKEQCVGAGAHNDYFDERATALGE
jgi:hypothetical protein